MVTLGELNTPMKDYFDVWLLSRRFDFQGAPLAKAIAATFERRKTEIPEGVPVRLSETFATEAIKHGQRKAFWRNVVRTEPTPDFSYLVEIARGFLLPPAEAAKSGKEWAGQWTKGGLWRAAKKR